MLPIFFLKISLKEFIKFHSLYYVVRSNAFDWLIYIHVDVHDGIIFKWIVQKRRIGT